MRRRSAVSGRSCTAPGPAYGAAETLRRTSAVHILVALCRRAVAEVDRVLAAAVLASLWQRPGPAEAQSLRTVRWLAGSSAFASTDESGASLMVTR